MIARPLHYCLKIASRPKSIDFYKNQLEMHVLRHEEFASGCEATCNGNYTNRWSKTMIGYGDEDNNFILELTYNYDVEKYEPGNDYKGIIVESSKLFDKLSSKGKLVNENLLVVHDPDNYPVQIKKGESGKVLGLELQVEKLDPAIAYWSGTLGMKQVERKDNYVDLVFKEGQANLRLIEIGKKIDHKTGIGRIAFATPMKNLLELNEKILASKDYKFKHNKVELGTPGKQTVTVIILYSHPDEYEICFVNDEDYSELSKCSEAQTKEEHEVLERMLKVDLRKSAQ